MKKRIFRTGLLVMSCFAMMAFMPGSVTDSRKPIYLNTAFSFEERAADLVSRMTLEEKQSLLGNGMAAIPRLGINSYNVWGEALHGVVPMFNPNAGNATSFPSSAALGSTWDPELMKREAEAIAEEARGVNSKVIANLTYWSPVVEPIRDPRWGRTGESYSEDPFHISRIAAGFIHGMMGDDPLYYKTVPTGKHYFANNSEFNRHVSSSDMDARDMREFYLAPYRSLIGKDKLPSIMSCYNAVNGVPVTASKFLVDTIARKTYGLKGYVTSDCGGVADIQTGHFYAKTNAEAAAMGLRAGVDTDCGSVYQTGAIDAVKEGLITENEIDIALVNLFTIRMKLGEFDPKSKVPYAHIQPDVVNAPGHVALAEEVATKTVVLLKNDVKAGTDTRILPVNPASLKKIAIIGPHADKVELGPYSGRPLQENMITPLAGIRDFLSKAGSSAEVIYSSGANTSNRSNLFNVIDFELTNKKGVSTKYDATKFTESAKGITIGSGMTGINSVRSIKDGDWTSYDNVDITEISKIAVNLSVPGDGGTIEARVGSPSGNVFATFDVTNAQGMGGGFSRARVVEGRLNQLGITGPQKIYLVYHATAIAPIDPETLAIAKSADVAIIFAGTDDQTAGEEADRLTLVLPGNQYELINAVAAVNPNTIVVMQTLGMVEVDQFKNNPNVKGMLWSGFNGQAQGAAAARVIFGDVNPGAKLNATWFKSVNDLPAITDYTLRGGADKNGRTYWYFNKDVSYEYGFGMSYSSFEYSNFRISNQNITPNDRITISFDIKNTGAVDGDEIAQVYVKTPDAPASLQRPIKRLKGFERVTIPAGQTTRVNIPIDCSELWFWDAEAEKISFDKGRYVFEIGASSKDIRGTVEASLTGEYKPFLKTVVAESGKVVLKSGSSVQTSVTAALSDDSFYDLKKADVKYQSNNPAVASVDNNGLVTANGVGTASITAYVTIDGKTVSDSYPVKIMPDLKLASITVNGKPVASFKPELRGYSFILAAGSAVPQVSVKQNDPAITVETVQATSVPGTATITLTDNVTVEKNTYTVSFGTKSVSDEFKAAAQGKQWSWVRENKADWSLTKTPGYMVITGQKGDLEGKANNTGNLFLQSANTDWTVTSRIVFSKKPTLGQQGGLIAYQDDDNYVKLVFKTAAGRRGMGFGPGASIEIVVEQDGNQSSGGSISAADLIGDDNVVFLKLVKKGTVYEASVSGNGKNFKNAGKADVALKDIKAGAIVCNGNSDGRPSGNFPAMPGMPQQASPDDSTPFTASYDYIRISSEATR